MRIFVALFLVISTLFGAARQSKPPLKIAEATLQHWVSGAPGGRTGSKYTVKIYIGTNSRIEYKNMWLGKANILFEKEFYVNRKTRPGDSLLLTYNKINGEKAENPDAKRLPIDYNGAALIEVLIDGKARYFIVKNFKQIADLRGQ